MPAKKKAAKAPVVAEAAIPPMTFPTQSTSLPTVTADPLIVDRIDRPDNYGGIVAASKFIVDRLRDAGLAHDIIIPPGKLGLHPCNRGKYGCHEDSVHQLAADIVEVGWDWEKIRGALCVEEDPSDRYIETYNSKICSNSEYLAPVEHRSIVAGTLTNGHTVLLLRAIAAGVKCDLPAVSLDGRMSLPHLENHRPEMAKAVREGWKWTMLSSCTRQVYGDKLFEMLSGVHNINLSRTPHECETLLKIFRQAVAFAEDGHPIDWNCIQKSALRTKPECSDYVASMIKFVKEFGGGAGANFVEDLCRFHTKHVAGQRLVGGAFFDAVTSVSFINKETKLTSPAPLLRYACLKAEYRCPIDRVQNRMCKFISKSDLDSLSKKSLAAAVEAEGVLSKCRQIVLSLGGLVSEDLRTKLFGMLDVNVVRVLLNKQQTSVVKFSSVASVASSFVADLRVALSDDSIENPWAGSAPLAATHPPHAPPTMLGMKTFTAAGNLVIHDSAPTLKAKGFDIGVAVASNSCKSKFMSIKSISDKVVLEGNDGEIVDVDVEKFASSWHLYEEAFFTFNGDSHASQHPQFQLVSAKAAVHVAMHLLVQAVGKPSVRIQAKPTKTVFADTAFKPATCVLVPESMNISTVMSGSAPPAAGIAVETDADTDVKFFASPSPLIMDDAKQPLTSPFWAVKTTAEPSEANMQLIQMSTKTTGKIDGKPALNREIKFWVLSNHKALKKGDELIVYKADSKGDSSKSASAAEPAAKKSRSK
jgi:hypothetical protein